MGYPYPNVCFCACLGPYKPSKLAGNVDQEAAGSSRNIGKLILAYTTWGGFLN